MTRLTLSGALALVPAIFVAGCNGANFQQPAPLDSGPPCSTILPIVSCDAGGAASPTSCTADPSSTDVVVSQIPTGNYPEGCTVQFYFDDQGNGCKPANNECTCLPAADGGAPTWSACADAGIQAQ